MPSLEARLARNDVMFRAINERITLKASPDDEVRAVPACFIVAPGHEATPLVERVLFQNSDFAIAREIGLAAEIARGLTEPS